MCRGCPLATATSQSRPAWWATCRASRACSPKQATSTEPLPARDCGAESRCVEADGTRSFREKIDLLAPHGLSGTASRSKRGVPALQTAHGEGAVGNALGLELAAFNRSRTRITDLADPRLSAEIQVAEIPALILAKGSKVGERLREPRKGAARDKDFGDLWRPFAVADPGETARVIAEFLDHPEVGADVRQRVEWAASVLRDPLSRERAKSTFDTFVDPAEIDRVFDLWRDVLPN